MATERIHLKISPKMILLKHVVSEHQQGNKMKGVALPQQQITLMAAASSTDISTTDTGSTMSLRERVNVKQIFGIAMLIVVDLIWVGSAGLTRYLFHHESYDKPFFTVYFKTLLFTIYLLPFLFWRPWQRLCCIDPLYCCSKWWKKTRKRRQNFPPQDNEIGDDDVFEDPKEEQQVSSTSLSIHKDVYSNGSVDSNLSCSEDSISSSGGYRLPTLLGPSSYKPLRSNECNEESESPHPLTLSESSTKQEQRQDYLTTSNSHAKRKRRNSRVRFSQTVEVKHVPSVSSIDNNDDDTSTENKSTTLLTVKHVMILSLPFGLLWFFANYLYARALDTQSVGTVNTLSSLSGVFVLILAAIPLPKVSPKDKFTLTKLVIIIISVGGAALVGLAPTGSSQETNKSDGPSLHVGAIYAVGGAILYASYLVMLSKAVPDEESLEIPMFFGFVGLFVSLIMAPLVVFWDYINWEEFELPPTNMTWTLLLINGFVGTVLSELLWLWGSLLTSSLVGTLSLSLVTPLSITYSIVIGETPISAFFICGALLTVLAFILVAIINHRNGWDPLWILVKKSVLLAKNYKFHSHFNGLSVESQSLLTEQDSNSSFDYITTIQ